MSAKTLVLVIESEPAVLASVSRAVEAAGYDVLQAEDSLVGLRQFFSSHPDIVILSLDAAEFSGWELVERIRALASTPIIVTSNEASVEGLQRGFDLQIDAFVAQPYDVDDLVSRLNAVRDRRLGDQGRRNWLYRQNGLTINWRSCEVFVHGLPVELTSTEFKLLTYLVQRRGWVLSHDQILGEVWGPEYVGEKDRVKLYVWYLRQKVEEDPSHPRLILTKRGLGYTFAD